ncbi:MAG: hypothetical protein LC663_04370 [Actinobacteria bacterium]|nr:hypothetical protein [Actinomycetota bacterium]
MRISFSDAAAGTGLDAVTQIEGIDEPNPGSLSLDSDLGRRFVLRAPGNDGRG